MKKRVAEANKITAFQTYLPLYQVEWIKSHSDTLIHVFIREQIEKLITGQDEFKKGEQWLSDN